MTTDAPSTTPAPAVGASQITVPIATREALKADPAFMELINKNDPKAREQYLEAWRVEHGMTPKPVAPEDAAAVAVQADERAIAEHQAVLDTWAGHTHPNLESEFQMARGLATRQQVEHSRSMIREKKDDHEFGRLVTTPGIGAKEKSQWASWHFAVYHCREVPDDFDWSKDAAT